MTDPSNLPELSQLPPTTHHYVVALGLDKLPVRSWSGPKPIKDIVALTGELKGQGSRLKKSRFEEVLKKLRDCHIYVSVYSSPIFNGRFSNPMERSDDSPGMEAKVKVSFHPGGFQAVGHEAQTARPAPESSPPPASPPPARDAAGDIAAVTSDIAEDKQVIPDVREARAAIVAMATDPNEQNLRRLLRHLYLMDNFLRQMGPLVETMIPALESYLHGMGASLREKPAQAAHSLTPASTRQAQPVVEVPITPPLEEDSDGRSMGALEAAYRRISSREDEDEDDEDEDDEDS
jgi:hypothetical protein